MMGLLDFNEVDAEINEGLSRMPAIIRRDFMKEEAQPYIAEATALTRKIHKLYSEGDPEAVKIVREFEKESRAFGSEISQSRLSRYSTWEIFYRNLHDLMARDMETKELDDKTLGFLESYQGFDLDGRAKLRMSPEFMKRLQEK